MDIIVVANGIQWPTVDAFERAHKDAILDMTPEERKIFMYGDWTIDQDEDIREELEDISRICGAWSPGEDDTHEDIEDIIAGLH